MGGFFLGRAASFGCNGGAIRAQLLSGRKKILAEQTISGGKQFLAFFSSSFLGLGALAESPRIYFLYSGTQLGNLGVLLLCVGSEES